MIVQIREKVINILYKIVPEGNYLDQNNQLNLDSMQNVQLIVHLEEEFGISIPYEYMNPDNFKELDKIIEIIKNI